MAKMDRTRSVESKPCGSAAAGGRRLLYTGTYAEQMGKKLRKSATTLVADGFTIRWKRHIGAGVTAEEKVEAGTDDKAVSILSWCIALLEQTSTFVW